MYKKVKSRVRSLNMGTNCILADIDYEAIDSEYSIFRVSPDGGRGAHDRMSRATCVIKALTGVLSVRYVREPFVEADEWDMCMFVLAKRGLALKTVRDMVENDNKGFQVSVLETSEELRGHEHVLLQLFLNSLSFEPNEDCGISNVAGHLYVMLPGWNRGDRKVLELTVKKGSHLADSISELHLFLSYDLHGVSKIDPNDDRYRYRTRYTYGDNYCLRVSEGPAEEQFVIGKNRYNEGTRVRANFISFNKVSHKTGRQPSYKNCRAYAVYLVLSKFNAAFDGTIHMSFAEVPFNVFECYSYESLKAQVNEIRTCSVFRNGINIVDTVHDSESSKCIRNIEKYLGNDNEPDKIQFFESGNISGDRFNIMIVRDKGYYQNHKVEDPYVKYDSEIVQHITIESFQDSLDNDYFGDLMDAVLCELVMKHEVREGRLELFDWKGRIHEQMSFTIHWLERTDLNDEQKMIVQSLWELTAVIDADGHISFNRALIDYEGPVKKGKKRLKNPDFALSISRGGDTVKILDTGCSVMPDIFEMYDRAEREEIQKMKGDDGVKLDKGLQGMWWARVGDGVFYTVGETTAPMKHYANRVLIRAVKPDSGSSNIFDEALMDMMDVPFVRLRRRTVLPFPAKLLEEYAKRKGVIEQPVSDGELDG